jgi:NAD(P)-dependent dehydrogenase (short-subunit alcohol dehydrogenase family)
MQIGGKVFVVTGGGNGIGREVVLELVRRGARVAAVDRRRESLEETRALALPTRVTAYELDITDRGAVEELPGRVIAELGQVDGVVNVAGIIQRFVHINDLTMDEIEHVLAVNFWGTLFMDKAFLPHLLARPEASIVNVSSMGALVPVPGQGAYGASKAAVKLLTECLFAELQGTNVAVTVVFPGAVGTRITENSGVEAPAMPAGAQPKFTSAPDAGSQIVDAIEKGDFRVLIGGDARMLDRLSRLAPTRAITTVAKRMKESLGL